MEQQKYQNDKLTAPGNYTTTSQTDYKQFEIPKTVSFKNTGQYQPTPGETP